VASTTQPKLAKRSGKAKPRSSLTAFTPTHFAKDQAREAAKKFAEDATVFYLSKKCISILIHFVDYLIDIYHF
jgi:hypothetical protein